MDWGCVRDQSSPSITSEYCTFHPRPFPSSPIPSALWGGAGNTKPLHVPSEISTAVLQTCCTSQDAAGSDQNSDAIYFKRGKNPNKWIFSYSFSCNLTGQVCAPGFIHFYSSGSHPGHTRHALIQKHPVMHQGVCAVNTRAMTQRSHSPSACLTVFPVEFLL